MSNVDPWHGVEIGEKYPENVNAIIEIPKNCPLKYEIDKKTGMVMLDRVLYSSVHYPGDYGFVPKTYAEDGDPLDVIVLTGHPVHPGVLASVRIIGVMHMVDADEKDDKLIAVYEKDPRSNEIMDISDLPRHTLSELKHFFETYKELQNKKVEVLEFKGREIAYEILKRSVEQYNKKFK